MNSVALHQRDWSQSQPASGSAAGRERWTMVAALLPLLGVTLFSKLAVPPLGAKGIGISTGLLVAPILIGCMTSRLRIHPLRFAGLAFLCGIFGIEQVLRPDEFSVSSLALMFVVHMGYGFHLSGTSLRRIDVTRLLADLSFLIACAGIVQYFVQFFLGASFAFPIENLMPKALLISGFNTQAQLAYQVEIYRINGIVMLEPSFLSQFLAIGIIAELCSQNRLARLATFGLAILLSYSGTGMIILAICMPVLIVLNRRGDILLLASGAVLALAMILPTLNSDVLRVDLLLDRANTFDRSGSSAFQRFVSGIFLLDQFFWQDTLRSLFGFGSGSLAAYATQATYAPASMAILQLLFEYGLTGLVAYLCFFAFCLFSSPVIPKPVALAIFASLLLNGLYTPFTHGLALTVMAMTHGIAMTKPTALSRQGTHSPHDHAFEVTP